ncbi:hypothetical protein SAMN02745129_2429 [Ferrimonas marina]|uniref:Uncharacterized protein n=1 Tax=Ferrimonas marina TaxID=299255 RepID=A0A1M5U6I8_9GAMM|nr:hypothetical protein SAMN02745129_2429 [Ferrimonas marina]
MNKDPLFECSKIRQAAAQAMARSQAMGSEQPLKLKGALHRSARRLPRGERRQGVGYLMPFVEDITLSFAPRRK